MKRLAQFVYTNWITLVLVPLGCVLCLFAHLQTIPPSPSPITVRATLPPKAELFDAQQVRPGTFTVEMSSEELRERSTTSAFRTLTTYAFGCRDSECTLYLQHWLSRGDNIFFHAWTKVPFQGWTGTFTPDVITPTVNGFVIRPKYRYRAEIVMYILGGLALFLGTFWIPLKHNLL